MVEEACGPEPRVYDDSPEVRAYEERNQRMWGSVQWNLAVPASAYGHFQTAETILGLAIGAWWPQVRGQAVPKYDRGFRARVAGIGRSEPRLKGTPAGDAAGVLLVRGRRAYGLAISTVFSSAGSPLARQLSSDLRST